MGRGIVLALLLAAGLSACGDGDSGAGGDAAPPSVPAASPTAPLTAEGQVTTMTTVLDDGGGPVMCLGDMAWTSPPSCDGPGVEGWDWADHPEHESASGVRWGRFDLVGAWDGSALTPTDVSAAAPLEVSAGPIGDYPFTTRCQEPEGGWVVVDPATTTNAAKGDANRVAEALPDYGIIWGDQSINPRWQEMQDLQESGGMPSLEAQQAMNDPALTILNVGVTDDPARAEAAVREVWGGPLCVYKLANTFAELRRVAKELQDLPGSLGAQFGTVSNRVDLRVIHDDGSIQAWADEEYGEGVVDVTSALEPVEQ